MFYSIYPKINERYSHSSIDDVFKEFENLISGKDLSGGFLNSKNISFDKDSNSFVVTSVVPGFDKSQLDIQYTNNVLTLKSEGVGSLGNKINSSYKIPTSSDRVIDKDAINASLENGVLTISLPVKKSSVTKKISIL